VDEYHAVTLAIERKADRFRQVYRRDAQLRVLRSRLPEAEFDFEGAV
jgi:hypothetical protein